MASGRCDGERDHPITLSFVYLYALLPPVTGMLGLPQVAHSDTIGCRLRCRRDIQNIFETELY